MFDSNFVCLSNLSLTRGSIMKFLFQVLVYLSVSASLMTIGVTANAATLQFNNKVQPQLLKAFSNQDKQDVLVFMKAGANLSDVSNKLNREKRAELVYNMLTEKALLSQKSIIEYLEKKELTYRPYYITNMILVKDATPKAVADLSKRSDVRKILINPKILNQVQPNLLTASRDRAVESNITYTGAKKVWEELGVRGKGIIVAGQDTGVEWDHPALKKSYKGYSSKRTTHAYNWHDAVHNSPNNPCGSDLEAPCDDNDHGTHTIGTVVGNDGDANEIGVAPDAKWIACRNMDAGMGSPATYIECFEFFLAPYKKGGDPLKDGDPTKAPHVINNSWSCPESEGCQGEEFLPVLQALEKAGIMVVVSAGNEGPGCSSVANPPAHHSNSVLSVGALNHKTEKIAGFSSRGPSAFDGDVAPHVAAPGVNIRSAVTNKKYEQSGWSGTSMAGPHVVGQVALMWSANPNLIGDIKKTKEIILETSKKKDAEVSCGGENPTNRPNNTYGYGIIDIYASVKKAIELK